MTGLSQSLVGESSLKRRDPDKAVNEVKKKKRERDKRELDGQLLPDRGTAEWLEHRAGGGLIGGEVRWRSWSQTHTVSGVNSRLLRRFNCNKIQQFFSSYTINIQVCFYSFQFKSLNINLIQTTALERAWVQGQTGYTFILFLLFSKISSFFGCGMRAFSSCPEAGGILVPQAGIKPTSPALQGGFLTTEPPGKSQYWLRFSTYL